MQLFGCQSKEYLSLCDTDVTSHDDFVYEGGGVRIKGCVTLALKNPNAPASLGWFTYATAKTRLDRKAFLFKHDISSRPMAEDISMFCDLFEPN